MPSLRRAPFLVALALALPTALLGAGSDPLADIPPGKVLWIGAHPDDEILVAPLLGELCATGRHACAILVATRGEHGLCRLAAGCHPDLATVRAAELRAAATIYHAQLIQGSLPDLFGPDPQAIRRAWADSVGGDDILLQRLAAAIASVAPRTIITFDSRHGTTCHDAHRAIGSLVLAAVARAHPRADGAQEFVDVAAVPEVFLLESRVRVATDDASILFSSALPGDANLLRFDARAPRAPLPGTAWDYLLDDAERQPSQFDATLLASLRAVTPAQRRVDLLRASAYPFDHTPVDLCAH